MACERLLLADLDASVEMHRESLLVRPILIVVPSQSLRLHLLDRIVTHRGGAAAGIRCLSLFGVAAHITSRDNQVEPPKTDLLPILVRRFASLEPSLQRSLDHLHDGYAAALAPVEDLLEAGFDPALEEALDEVLEEEGGDRASFAEVERARALLRIASRCAGALSHEGATRVPDLLKGAAELIRRRPDRLQASAVLVYGFADATGVATDLIQALLESSAGTIYLDQPADPASPDQAEAGIDFGRRFTERIFLVTATPAEEPRGQLPSSIEMARALGTQAEIRHVANRIRLLLDEGVQPERVGVVARRLDPYVSVLRTHFWRMGIPFSGIGSFGPLTQRGRQVGAVLDLLKQGRRAPIERWLDASLAWTDSLELDLRLALFGFGAGRLEEAADLDLEPGTEDQDLPLPVLGGLAESEAGEDPMERRRHRRTIPGGELVRARGAARRLCERFDAWQRVESLSHHSAQLQALLLDDLQWPAHGELTASLTRAIERLRAETRDDLPLTFEELVRWLDPSWSEIGRDSLGGRGGGVQVLDVTEARGRTFEHLFLVGLNRGAFPRQVREDPLLPDSLRQALSREGHGVLPDLARKLSGFDEERFLFAQLLAASPSVALSWQAVDDDGQPSSVSPLVERLRWSEAAGDRPQWREPPTVEPLFTLSPESDRQRGTAPRLAYEHAVSAAMRGTREELGGFLSAAMAESTRTPVDWTARDGMEELPLASDPDRFAAARIRILRELDPIRGQSEGESTFKRLGPFFGLVGPILDDQDLRSAKRLYVTDLENLAACSWQTFLSRLLRLETLPDPLEILPGISPVLVGDLVHRCLERLVGNQLPVRAADLEAARDSTAKGVTWPTDREVDRLLDRVAELVARRHGIGMRGFPRMLARVARPYLDQAHDLDWPTGTGVPVAAVEVEGRLTLYLENGDEQDLYFKADRMDIDAAGERLVDYKTGKNDISTAATASARRKSLIKGIRAGRSLQAVTYAQSGRTEGSSGRYLFLKPDIELPHEAREIGIDKGDEEAQLAFRRSTSILLEVWNRGFLPPQARGSGSRPSSPALRVLRGRRGVPAVRLGGEGPPEVLDGGASGVLHPWAPPRH